MQQAPNTFRSSYSSRLTSSGSDYLGNYAAGSTRSTDDNDRILDFIRNRRPFFRDRSFSTANYADTIITKRDVVPPPVPAPELERKPERVYFEVTKPDDEVVKEIVKEPTIPIVEVLSEIQTMAIEEKRQINIPNEKTYYKENLEIECLSEKDELPLARKKREVDYVLSDEEIVEHIQPEVKSTPYAAPPTPPALRRDLSAPSTPKKDVNVGKLPRDVTAKFDAPVTYPRSPIRSPMTTRPSETIIRDDVEDLSPVTKRSLVEHQKSIEQLKAALSIEEPENETQEPVVQNEETDVTESSSEVWQPQQQIEDWQNVQEQPIIPSDVEEIENQFAEIVNNPSDQPVEQYYEEQQPVYEEQQNEIVDYSEEQYPESYYEQPAQPHYPTNIASNVILEEDEYEEQEYAQEQKPEYEQNYQEQNYEYQQDGQYQQDYQNYQQDNFYDENQQQQNYNYDENNQQYQQNYDQNYQQENYPQEGYQENNQQYQNYSENNYQNQEFDQNNQQYDQSNQQYDQSNQEYDQNNQQYDQNNQQYDQSNQQYDQSNQQYDTNTQQYDQNNQQYDQNDQQYDQSNQQYDQNYTQEGEYTQPTEQVPQEEYQYPQEQTEGYQQDYQGEQDTTALQTKQSNLAHLLESDSESYQIEHGGGGTGNEDSDFDFSLSQKQ